MKLEFPKGFYWGAATSSHQVEGNNHNDWSQWEKKNAGRLVKEAIVLQESKNLWSEQVLNYHPNPLEVENYISGRACDHYNRFREDFDIAKTLGHNAHRFSIEWSRIEPEEGKFDEKEIEHYRQVILALKERGIEPFVTLWHWTLPIWLAQKGGVRNKDFPKYFERYVNEIVRSFNSVKYWLTINEPEIYALNSYSRGRWPPQKRGALNFYLTVRTLIKAHERAYGAIKKILPLSVVGVVCNLSDFASAEGIVNVLLSTMCNCCVALTVAIVFDPIHSAALVYAPHDINPPFSFSSSAPALRFPDHLLPVQESEAPGVGMAV